jgi:hypothetical protein
VRAGVAAGWLLGGPAHADRTAMAMATSVRNVAVTLVIAVASFPGTPAVTAATGFRLFQIILVALLAARWPVIQRYLAISLFCCATPTAIANS